MLRSTLDRIRTAIALLASLALLVGCEQPTGSGVTEAPRVETVRPVVDPALLARGEALFKQNCAACHGERAQGAPNWQKPGPDGKYPAPPLDGSAHAWHHPLAALKQTIREGTQKLGGSMPPWQEKLTQADIEAVIVWFQSLWPEPIYREWTRIDQYSRK